MNQPMGCHNQPIGCHMNQPMGCHGITSESYTCVMAPVCYCHDPFSTFFILGMQMVSGDALGLLQRFIY